MSNIEPVESGTLPARTLYEHMQRASSAIEGAIEGARRYFSLP
jgi:hypothetical protein